jgi:hypothetical protein
VAILIIGLGAWQSYRFGERNGQAWMRQQWQSDQLLQANQRVKDEQSAREREHQIQQRLFQIQLESRRVQKEITERYALDLERLRERPERPDSSASPLPSNSATCLGGTGSGLARGDAAFLAGYAADAARLAEALVACQVVHDRDTTAAYK